MNKVYKFYKDPDTRWYADIPEWAGSKADLEMVAGADAMLEYFSEGEDEVKLFLSTEEFEGATILDFIREATEYQNGAFYFLGNHMGIDLSVEMWLCDVTKFVFGDFPKKIYLSKSI